MTPRLLHPVPVIVETLERASTIYDPDFREPVQNVVRGAPVTCPGQVKWGLDQALESSRSGPKEEADGYALFKLADLAALGVTLKREDRFTSLGGIAADVYVVALRYEGHYPHQGGPALVKAFFKDRHTSTEGV